MNTLLKSSLLMTTLSSVIYAGGDMKKLEFENTVVEKNELANNLMNGFFSSYGIGGSKIMLDDTYHKALVISSKTGYMFENDISIYLLGESNYYRHTGDINDMGISGIGMGYAIPYTSNKFTIDALVGIGMNINYNKVFKKFNTSYDFGLAYRTSITYQINNSFNINMSYSKFDFNTNATELEDTKPKIFGINFTYSFDAKSFLD